MVCGVGCGVVCGVWSRVWSTVMYQKQLMTSVPCADNLYYWALTAWVPYLLCSMTIWLIGN